MPQAMAMLGKMTLVAVVVIDIPVLVEQVLTFVLCELWTNAAKD